MRVLTLSILFLAALSLAVFGVIPVFVPIAGFGEHQFAERQSRQRIEALGSRIQAEAKIHLVSDAADRLREIFNRGACEQIYRDAAIASFRLGPEQQWTDKCEQLRIRSGEWRSFSAQETVHCSTDDSVICVNGMALFESGSYPLHIAWQWNGGNPALWGLTLGAAGQQMLNWPGSYIVPKTLSPVCDPDSCA